MARIFEEDFNGFTAAGFAPSPTSAQLDSDIWRVAGFSDNANPAYGFTGASGTDFGRGTITTNDPTTGGVYSPASNNALVAQPTGGEYDVNGFMESRIQNTSGAAATGFTIDFDWIYRNSGERADNMTFSYSTNGSTFTAVPGANFSTPATSASGAAFTTAGVTPINLSGVSVADGGYLYLRWTHTGSTGSGNRDEIGIDNVTVDTTGGGTTPTGTTLSISATDAVKAEGAAGATTPFTFTVTRGGDATAAGSVNYAVTGSGAAPADAADFTGGTLPSGTVNFAAGATSATVTVNVAGDATVEPNENFTVTLSGATGGATIGTGTATGTIQNDEVTVTSISTVQGSGAASTLVGQTVTVEAIVVGDFQNGDGDSARSLGGFYLQELNGDGDAATSDGIFIYEGTGNFLTNVAEGDRVRVTGTVIEFNGLTEITATSVSVVQAGAVADIDTLATTATITGTSVDLERYEGMLVTLPQTLVVTEQFDLDRYNEIRLYASEGDGLGGAVDEGPNGRPYQFTQTNDPGASANAAHVAAVAGRTIVYGDGLTTQNQPIDLLDGYQTYGTPGAPGAPQMGDSITGATGVLDYSFSNYTLRPVNDGDNTFTDTNPREAQPEEVGGRLKVGGFNVLNYFATLDGGGATTENSQEPRGASSDNGANAATEFQRQTEKLVTAIVGLDADVLSLIELENDFLDDNPYDANRDGNAIEYLVEQINARLGDDVYSYIYPGSEFIGGDAIAVGMIYKNDAVRVADGTSIAVNLDPTFNRPPLAVTFEEIGSGERFTAVANHFKSKSATGASGENLDQGDGQGAYNAQRVDQAEALATWLGTNPTGTSDGDYLLLGDYNAYYHEDPIKALQAAGYNPAFPDTNYSYTFDGQIGTLDYALANASLTGQITGITDWHINSDEADANNYNLDFGRDPDYFNGQIPYSVSDHDPVLVGLDLGNRNSGSLVVRVSEDEYLGDAQFEVFVDGISVGTRTATASHAANQHQNFVFDGDFSGADEVQVRFLNDQYGGSPNQDRNLYVDSITLNGTTFQGEGEEAVNTAGANTSSEAILAVPGTLTFDFAPNLTVRVAGDAYQGNAQFIVLVDGEQVGGVRTVTASHAQGQFQDIAIAGVTGNPDSVAVQFLNDLYGGSASQDRNLYVDSITLNGQVFQAENGVNTGGANTASEAILANPGSVTFDTNPNLTLRVSQDAYLGNAQFIVRADGEQLGGVYTVSSAADHAGGNYQDFEIGGLFGEDPISLEVEFLNDVFGGASDLDRNLYVDKLTFNGVEYEGEDAINLAGQNTDMEAIMAQNGTLTFGLLVV